MDKEHTIGLVLFIAVFMAAQFAYMRSEYVRRDEPILSLNNQEYQQVGLVEIEDNGQKLYSPVYKKRNSK